MHAVRRAYAREMPRPPVTAAALWLLPIRSSVGWERENEEGGAAFETDENRPVPRRSLLTQIPLVPIIDIGEIVALLRGPQD